MFVLKLSGIQILLKVHINFISIKLPVSIINDYIINRYYQKEDSFVLIVTFKQVSFY